MDIINKNFLLKWVAGTLITIIFIYFITSPFIVKPLYESEIIIYAPQLPGQKGLGLSDEKETDWFIQVLKSTRMADSLIKSFDLNTRYNIDVNTPYVKSILYKLIGDRISVQKTRYGSISVKVLDWQPEIASKIANRIVGLSNSINTDIFNQNRLEEINFARTFYEQKATELIRMQRSLDSLRRIQLLEEQEKGYNGYYVREKAMHIYNLEIPELVSRKQNYELIKHEYEAPLPSAYIVSSAVPASRPEKPRRYLLLLSGVGFYLFGLIIFEIIRNETKLQRHKIL